MKFSKSYGYPQKSSLDKYLKEIGRNAILSPEEEVAIMKKIREGDTRAFETLVKCNLKFVVTVANQYQGQGLSLEDLINEGNIGLIKAIERFDETKGFKFISYAVWWIRQSIMQAISEQTRIVRLPGNKLTNISKVAHIAKDLENSLERVPSPSEIADKLSMELDEVVEAMESISRYFSLDAPMYQDNNEINLMDIIPDNKEILPDSPLMQESLKKDLRMSLSVLSLREAEIVKLYYGIDTEHPLTLDEIGYKFNLTRERIRQIKDKAIRKLQHNRKKEILEMYL
ncbi:MAG: RNA polymerase sigma factor RpoD/SigA [Bacillota bacterium]